MNEVRSNLRSVRRTEDSVDSRPSLSVLQVAVVVLAFTLLSPVHAAEVNGDLDGDGDVDQNDINILLADRSKRVHDSACGSRCDLDGDGRITVRDARLLALLCTQTGCARIGAGTTTFSDLEPTQPRQDEVTALPVDLDGSFPSLAPPVLPGPPGLVASHIFDHPTIEESPAASFQLPTFGTRQLSPVATGEGRWLGPDQGLPRTGEDGSGDAAIHAALLRRTAVPTKADSGADILWFAGDANTQGASVNHTGVFRLINPIEDKFEVKKIPSPERQHPPPEKARAVDLFCSGHALLEDGRLLVVGGTEAFPDGRTPPHRNIGHHTAIRDTFIFDPKTHTWIEASPMAGGRWYPSLVTLNSGRVVAFWGHPTDDDPRHTNDTPEIFSLSENVPNGAWEFLGRETDVPTTVSVGYPRVHLLPNGRILRASPVPDGDSTMNVQINPIRQSLTDPNRVSVRVSSGPGIGHNLTGDTSYSSVLLPLTPANRYRARVLLVGGGLRCRVQALLCPAIENVTGQSEAIDLETDTAAATNWRPLANPVTQKGSRDPGIADKARIHANATILPTGEVFVSGGTLSIFGTTPVLEGEIYNPFTNTWRTVASSKVAREYHSVALLMPDGRVWHAGTSVNPPGQGLTAQDTRVDIYQPWYYTETRPLIGSMQGPEDPVYPGARVMHLHHSGVTVEVDHFRPVVKFALIRAGSVTHAFNYGQRYIELDWQLVNQSLSPAGGVIVRFTFRLTSPPSSNIAPPGNYMLFAIDDRGVPSVGRFIRIDRRFVGELKQEAEHFTSGNGVSAFPFGTGDATALHMQWSQATGDPVVEYGGIDFGSDEGVVRHFSLVAGSPVGGLFEVRLDRREGPLIATLEIPPGGAVERGTPVTPSSGVHNVFIKFKPRIFQQTSFAIVDWFKLRGPGPSVVIGPPPAPPTPVQ